MASMQTIITLTFVKFINSAMEPFIIDGRSARINNHPHSIYLEIYCQQSVICGGSILNQLVTLTAAHCLEHCSLKFTDEIFVKYGHELKNRMLTTESKKFIIHEKYMEANMQNDIALLLVKTPIALGRVVMRVALMRSPPYHVKLASVAGWGVKNEKGDGTLVLLEGQQEVQSPSACWKIFQQLPPGTFCAGPTKYTGSPGMGDSGSALVIRDYIQIGLVSFKMKIERLVVYTNVSYHYDWIRKNSASIVCNKN